MAYDFDEVKPQFRVNFDAYITYEDGREEHINKNVYFQTDHVPHDEITQAYIEFLAGCGFSVQDVGDLNG